MKRLLKGFALLMALLLSFCVAACGEGGERKVRALSLDVYELSLPRYEEYELTAYLPEELAGEKVEWKTGDQRKVKVTASQDSLKAVITTLDVTNSPVLVTASCKEQKATCKITVTEAAAKRRIAIFDEDGIPFTGAELNLGDTCRLKAKFYEGDEELPGVSVNWRSSDETRIAVDGSGLVTALDRAGNINVFAEATYKGQTIAASAAFSVISDTDDSLSMRLIGGGAGVQLTEYEGDASALGFPAGSQVTRYTVASASAGGYGARIFPGNAVASANGKTYSDYDKLVFYISFEEIVGLPKLRLYFGAEKPEGDKYIEVELGKASLTQSDGGAVIAFFSPSTKQQATSLQAKTVYACVVDLAQLRPDSDASAYGLALTGAGEFFYSEVSGCTDYVYANKIENDVHKYGYPTPSGRYTSGAYLCYAEVGGYANVARSSDVAVETQGPFAGWNKIPYRRECLVTPSGVISHTHRQAVNPICNRIMPMLPTIGTWAASLGNNGYWQYEYWGMDFALGSELAGAYDNEGNTQFGTDINFFIVSGNELDLINIAIDEDGYIVRCSTKKGTEFKAEELDILDRDGKSVVRRDEYGYYVNIEAGTVYTLRVKIYKSLDSYGFGVYSESGGYWYASNPYFEK